MLLSELAMASGMRYEGEDRDIVSIEYDSRKVKPGSMFCCIVGALFDGHTFAEGAIQNGASALLVERVREAAQLGYERVVLPEGNCAAEDAPAGCELVPIRTVGEALEAAIAW